MIIELEVDHTFAGTSNSTFVVFKDGRERRVLRAKRGTTYLKGQRVKVVLDENEEFINWPAPSNVHQIGAQLNAS